MGTKRCLLSIDPQKLGSHSGEVIPAVCQELGMPHSLSETVLHWLPEATFVHFGFEDDRNQSRYKVYFEQQRKPNQAGEPILLHVAFKWKVPSSEQWVESRYFWYPDQTPSDLCHKIGGYHRDPESPLLESIRSMIKHAGSAELLEVREERGGRFSYDLNFYDSNVGVQSIRDELGMVGDYFGIPEDVIETLLSRIGSEDLGHIASGLHRDGEEFLTLYFGARIHHGHC
tara:strand:- start:15736 stop:16422 length:687 start_codon:yes stop_codon:yes gene_type:complete